MSKIIICGGRDIEDYSLVVKIIKLSEQVFNLKVSILVCGMQRGVDLLAKKYTDSLGIPCIEKPYIKELGKKGGPVRNSQMLELAEACIAIRDCRPGQLSRGTDNMIMQWKNKNGNKNLVIYNYV